MWEEADVAYLRYYAKMFVKELSNTTKIEIEIPDCRVENRTKITTPPNKKKERLALLLHILDILVHIYILVYLTTLPQLHMYSCT